MARSADSKRFSAPPKSEFEDLATQNLKKTYEKITIISNIFGTKFLSSFLMLAIYFLLKCLCYKPVVPKLGVNYPQGVICGSSGETRNQNHNVVLYYERSLRNIEGN